MGLQQDILNHSVSELDLRDVIVVNGSTTVRQSLALMREKRLGCVAVVDADGKMIGKFTERLLVKLLLDHPDGLDHAVSDHMADKWDTVQNSSSIADVIHSMESRKLRFVVVADEAGRPIALTGQKSVMEYIVDHFPRQVRVQRMSSEFFTGQREGG